MKSRQEPTFLDMVKEEFRTRYGWDATIWRDDSRWWVYFRSMMGAEVEESHPTNHTESPKDVAKALDRLLTKRVFG